MNLLRFILALVLIAFGAVALYYRMNQWPIPPFVFYGLLVLTCIFLIVFLISYANRPPKRR